jgi:hypothetical protein
MAKPYHALTPKHSRRPPCTGGMLPCQQVRDDQRGSSGSSGFAYFVKHLRTDLAIGVFQGYDSWYSEPWKPALGDCTDRSRQIKHGEFATQSWQWRCTPRQRCPGPTHQTDVGELIVRYPDTRTPSNHLLSYRQIFLSHQLKLEMPIKQDCHLLCFTLEIFGHLFFM